MTILLFLTPKIDRKTSWRRVRNVQSNGLMPHPTAPSPLQTTTQRIRRSRKRASIMARCPLGLTQSSNFCTSHELRTKCQVLPCQAPALMVQQSPQETTLKLWVVNLALDTLSVRLACKRIVRALETCSSTNKKMILLRKSLNSVAFLRQEKTRCCRDHSRQDSHFSEKSA